jgi:branched-subunit amino acid ABC-type transport system permease component
MLFLLSPAKSLDYESALPPVKASEPQFVPQSTELISTLKKKSLKQIAELMDLSDALAQLNVDRYKAWSPQFTETNARPAVLAFTGDVYEGLDAKSLKPKDFLWAQDHVAIILVTCLLVGLLYAFFTRTRIGVAMQAASQNQMAAGYMGIPIKRVSTLIWAMSAAVAAIAGVLLAPITFIHSHLGFIGIKAFPAAVLGGFGSMPGAVVGGLILGVCESLAGFYLPEGVKDVTAYVLLLAVLAFRPQGLFGQTTAKKV